ncbi:hypothetical protein CONPUDRAFT_151791 [Coniophora puteana RWD-64-598 SS2]|uniref:Uncharacterized protein n=1 Tax=Coniophora puteana (strain RWD-64-598) TaxID=741705 RepID=A0A5M3MUE6_CONPW|nr:uncharacterized protein CONPUDRAFT_151791 [Coniophora puteana RWD-64-598 SS2]EIW82733.1 hypothetical protein CONPUDRAFT_151791 [Coniophora puteana RWD-64-598 SS2]
MSTSSPSGSSDPKRPYGGLVPSQPKGTRAYQDAASYNQHLAQHQAYTAQAQAASQAANNVHRNPYISPPGPAHQSSSGGSSSVPMQVSGYGPNAPPQPDGPSAFPSSTHYGYAGSSQGAPQAGGQMQNAPSAGSSAYNQSSTLNLLVPGQQQGPPAPASTYYPNAHARTRANTINHQLDAVPPALARLQHMNTDVIGGRNALTPVLNRDDAMREWERRQAGKASTAQPYPQLEYLQQQAELVAAGGMPAGAGAGGSGAWPAGQGPGAGAARYAGSKLTHSYQPTIVVDDDRREQVMSTVRNAARVEAGGSGSYNPAGVVTSPTAAYQPGGGAGGGGGGGGGGPRYQQPYSGQPTSPFDSLGQRTDIGTMYVPMQPEQYQSYAPGARSAGGAGGSGMGGGAGGQPSFYGAGVAAAVSQARGNPFPGQGQSGGGGGGQGEGQGVKDSRRMSGMDIWNAR